MVATADFCGFPGRASEGFFECPLVRPNAQGRRPLALRMRSALSFGPDVEPEAS